MNGKNRKDILPGLRVSIILKQNQRTGRLTEGIVKDILTSAPFHSRGIKVRLADGQVGRVHAILQKPTMSVDAKDDQPGRVVTEPAHLKKPADPAEPEPRMSSL